MLKGKKKQSEETNQASGVHSDMTDFRILIHGIKNNHDYYVKGSNGKGRQHTKIDEEYKQREGNSKKKSKENVRNQKHYEK